MQTILEIEAAMQTAAAELEAAREALHPFDLLIAAGRPFTVEEQIAHGRALAHHAAMLQRYTEAAALLRPARLRQSV